MLFHINRAVRLLYAALKALDIPVMDLTTCSRVCSLRGDKQGNNVDA